MYKIANNCHIGIDADLYPFGKKIIRKNNQIYAMKIHFWVLSQIVPFAPEMQEQKKELKTEKNISNGKNCFKTMKQKDEFIKAILTNPNDSKATNKKATEEIKGFEVLLNKNRFNTKCLHIVTTDNKKISISKTILIGRKKDTKTILFESMRQEIEDQIEEFKNFNSNTKPEIDAEVDHEVPFESITKQTDEEIRHRKLNTEMKSEWINFHRQYAKLRWLTKKENRNRKF
ncbi:hypothetical protein BpHYR1_026862 [Brachionus plicatilis]|uniref:Uncharacterized protein n=1 Tax=Brachionus plicatilis TaxID=10195 RepID=A0A3M7RNU5_BRAPC|nr:hypothetical protein BpHYR1_026862 [Brachionus plicatilis]